MTKRTFGPQLVKQSFSLLEHVGRELFTLEEIAKTALNFRFGKQGDLPGNGTTHT
jgi:hypothetical protein